MKRYYVCNGCATKHAFETTQDYTDGLIVALCPSCGKLKEFLMVDPSEEAGLEEEIEILTPDEIKLAGIALIAMITAIVGCALPVSQTTGAMIICPIQVVIVFTLLLRVVRISLRMGAQGA